MENNKIKGCVYFFRHIGLKPVKIGYSTNESPINRFEAFKTYAPYGAELLGFIMTFDAKNLETTLHEKFSQHRINGEWFEIDENKIDEVIKFYSNIEDIKEKNEFQIAWAKKINDQSNNLPLNDFFKIYSINKTDDYNLKSIVQMKEIHLFKNSDAILEYLIKNKCYYKVNRLELKSIKGFLLYKKIKNLPI